MNKAQWLHCEPLFIHAQLPTLISVMLSSGEREGKKREVGQGKVMFEVMHPRGQPLIII